MSQAVCEECNSIAREIKNSYRETWLSADREFRAAWIAIRRLAGGTEEDVVRAEELLPKAAGKGPPRIGNAIRRKFVHEARSGHRVRLRETENGS